MTQSSLAYETAAAFRNALKDRFQSIAASDHGFSLSELQRQFAYDRALARCFSGADADRWVLKGAGALLARLEQARHSKDLDLFYAERAAADGEAVEALQRDLGADIGDHFGFEVTRTTPLPEAAKGRRVHVRSRLGAKTYASFHIDVVVGTAMSGEPELVAPLTPIEVAGLVRPSYRTFPLADHIADKLSATVEVHHQAGQVRPSSRVKDLVDLALIARTQAVSGVALRTAIRHGFAHRDVAVPVRFAVPDEDDWRLRYPRVARDAPGRVPSYDEAVAVACRLLDPVLSGEPVDRWDPMASAWNR
jgi:hypothetical protein